MERVTKTYEELLAEAEDLRWKLDEATETLHAIRTGQVDALVVKGKDGHELYSLKTADQTYRVFIEKMNEGALTLNEAGVILYSNSMFAEMIGRPLTKVLGRPFKTFVAAHYHKDYEVLFEKGWAEDAKLEIEIKGAGHKVPCQVSVTTLQLDEGTALSVILTDLTYQKEVQALLKANNARLEESNTALEKSNQDLLQFASVASHDLQEPLRKMLLFGDLLKVRLGTDLSPDTANYLNKILTSSNRMKRLISDILSYSSIGVGNAEYADVSLHEVVLEIIDDFEIMIQEKGAAIEVRALPVIPVAKGQIRQLFQNLISNALKFSAPDVKPQVSISTEDSDDENFCIIAVADNGIGFDAQYADKIFSLFQRLNTKDKYEGSGIGLAVAKKIVDKHGGSITAESKVGEGSTFRMKLPCKR